MENKLWVVVALAAGVAVGMNWGKIQKSIGPYGKLLEEVTVKGYNTMVGFVAEQKEHLEDMIAASKIQKGRATVVSMKQGRRARAGRVRAATATA